MRSMLKILMALQLALTPLAVAQARDERAAGTPAKISDGDKGTMSCVARTQSEVCQKVAGEPGALTPESCVKEAKAGITDFKNFTSCASGVFASITDLVKFLGEAVMFVASGANAVAQGTFNYLTDGDSRAATNEGFKDALVKSGDYLKSIYGYISIEYQKAFDTVWPPSLTSPLRAWEAAKNLAGNMIGSLLSAAGEIISGKYEESRCYDTATRTKQICQLAGTILLPPAAFFALLKGGAKALAANKALTGRLDELFKKPGKGTKSAKVEDATGTTVPAAAKLADDPKTAKLSDDSTVPAKLEAQPPTTPGRGLTPDDKTIPDPRFAQLGADDATRRLKLAGVTDEAEDLRTVRAPESQRPKSPEEAALYGVPTVGSNTAQELSGFLPKVQPLSQVLDTPMRTIAGRTPEPVENFLKTKEIRASQIKPLGGGVNQTSLITWSDNNKAVWKPHDPTMWASNARAEVLAYELSARLKFNLVPPTVETTINGQKGSLQWFSKSVGQEMADPMQLRKQSLFDFMIDNRDRHRGNWLATESGRVVSIDNGLSFTGLGYNGRLFKGRQPEIEAFLTRSPESPVIVREIRASLRDPKFRQDVVDYLGRADGERLMKRMRFIIDYSEKLGVKP